MAIDTKATKTKPAPNECPRKRKHEPLDLCEACGGTPPAGPYAPDVWAYWFQGKIIWGGDDSPTDPELLARIATAAAAYAAAIEELGRAQMHVKELEDEDYADRTVRKRPTSVIAKNYDRIEAARDALEKAYRRAHDLKVAESRVSSGKADRARLIALDLPSAYIERADR